MGNIPTRVRGPLQIAPPPLEPSNNIQDLVGVGEVDSDIEPAEDDSAAVDTSLTEPNSFTIPVDVLRYYESIARPEPKSLESLSAYEQLETLRVREVLARYVNRQVGYDGVARSSRRPTGSSGAFLDVGCGNGAHGVFVALLCSHLDVILVDPCERNVAIAQNLVDDKREALGSRAVVKHGDGIHMPRVSESAQFVLLHGAAGLQHLTRRDARRRVLVEAWRVLVPGGTLFAVCMSRFAMLMSTLFSDAVMDDVVQSSALVAELEHGQHVPRDHQSGGNRAGDNPPSASQFTSCFTYKPNQLRAEVMDAGFEVVSMIAIEGPMWLLQDLQDGWHEHDRRAFLLQILRRLESEPSLLGMSAHFMVVARKPGGS